MSSNQSKWRGLRGIGSFGHGSSSSFRNLRGTWRPGPSRKSVEVSRPPSPPLGPILTTLRERDLEEFSDQPEPSVEIFGCSDIASYNWLNRQNPTIMLPGKPPSWTPLASPTKLKEDDGEYFRDPNAARYPRHPIQPAVEAVLTAQPEFPTSSIDIFACNSTLGNLLRFVRRTDKSFRILVQAIGRTVFLVRRENSPTELIPDVVGFGYSFPEAYTTWEADVKGSVSHQRIIRYRFAGLDCLVRFEADGYLKEKVPEESEGSLSNDVGGTVAADELLASALDNSSITNRPTSVDKPVTATHGGQQIPQKAIFDLKTRSFRKKDRDILGEELPRLWVSQIPNFILAFHEDGLFKDIQIREVRSEIQQWERENADSLHRFAVLLKKIVAFAYDQPGGKLEIVRHEAEPDVLELRGQCDNVPETLPADLAEEWIMGPPDIHDYDEEDLIEWSDRESTGERSEEESRKDFTTC